MTSENPTCDGILIKSGTTSFRLPTSKRYNCGECGSSYWVRDYQRLRQHFLSSRSFPHPPQSYSLPGLSTTRESFSIPNPNGINFTPCSRKTSNRRSQEHSSHLLVSLKPFSDKQNQWASEACAQVTSMNVSRI